MTRPAEDSTPPPAPPGMVGGTISLREGETVTIEEDTPVILRRGDGVSWTEEPTFRDF